MRVVVDLSTNDILQVERTPDIGESTTINGKYVVETPAGQLPIDSSSYVLPVDGGDIFSLGYQQLLDLYPMFNNIVFNPLVRATDVASFDLSATVDNASNQVLSAPYTGNLVTRAQVGRGSAPFAGTASLSTAILGANPQTTPPKPGVLVTDTIDISAATSGAGANEFMVYWKIYGISTSEDIISDFGVFANTNSPAIRSIEEVNQEGSGFVVAVSIDDGASFTPINRLEPASFCVNGTQIRLAFLNTTSSKVYLATYALLF